MNDPLTLSTFLFTDIQGSTRLWEDEPARMREALARHDALAREAVERHRGSVVKTTGDGLYAVFAEALDAVRAIVALQLAIADPAATAGVALPVRSGLHAGEGEHRDNDYFGRAVNRAARVMGVAHGGQIVLSQAVVDQVSGRLPAPLSLVPLGTVRLRDLSRPEPVCQLVHPGLRRDFPALRSLEATPNNLPQQLTSFVGRDDTQADLEAALRSTRLLTLVGVGGLGKTRLSLQVAADALDDYPDGVWFVELAPLSDAALVPHAVASVLGVRDEPGASVHDALARYVADRRLLLVLDNCEHLVEACAVMAKRLLEAGPQLRILTSSREPLHVLGETTFPVPALAVPGPDGDEGPAELARCGALQLFRDRANAARPDLALTPGRMSVVAAICRRLDGIPLALELAAARVRTLSLETIAARLSDRFTLLTGGDRTALPRQQTLRACLDWSYDLLTRAERTLLARTAVFAGGFTLEAAEAVGADDEGAVLGVLDLLSRLVEQSLVEFDAEAPRYRMLETVREYALERLAQSGFAAAVRTRHLGYCLRFAGAAADSGAAERGAWLVAVDRELDNLLAAHAWCDHVPDGAALGLDLVVAIARMNYWVIHGLPELGYRVTTEALERPGAERRVLVRCRALLGAAQFGYYIGRLDEAHAQATESLAIAGEIGDSGRMGGALTLLGGITYAQGDAAAARDHFARAIALARGSAQPIQLSNALNDLAEIHQAEGDLDLAEPLYLEALALQRHLSLPSSRAILLQNLARVAIERGQPNRARAPLLESLDIADEQASTYLGLHALEVAYGLAALSGDWPLAARLYGAASVEREKSGQRRLPADEAFLAKWVGRTRDALGDAAFEAAHAAGRAAGYRESIAAARALLAR